MKKATIKAVVSILGGLIVFGVAFFIFQSSPSTSEATMTRQEAERIAQDQFQGEVVSVELDDGRYEIEIETEDARYQLEIDAETGRIIKLEEGKSREQVAQKPEIEGTNPDEIGEQATAEFDDQEVEIKQEKPKAEKNQSNQTTNKPSENVIISLDDASKIAHEQVPNATIIEIELDSDDGQRYYEIEMHTDDQEVEIEIDAYTGKVIMIEYERLEGSRKGNSEIISMDEAKQISLAKEPSAKIVGAKLDRDDGKYYYEIEMETSKYEIEIEIDALTGKIIDLDYDDRD